MKRLTILTGMAILLGAGGVSADERFGNDHYTDKYLSKSVRLLQAERAYDAGFSAGRKKHDRIAESNGGTSGFLTSLQATDQPIDLKMAPHALGQGRGVRLADAVSRILPSSCWKAEIDADLMDIKVDWIGNKPWTEVIRDLSARYHFHSYVNKADCKLFISAFPYFDESADGNPHRQVWMLPKGKRLSEVLNEWATMAGWSFEWAPHPKDIIIDHPAQLVGQFDSDSGVIAQVVDSFAHTKLPLQYEFNHVNRVLVIRESRYNNAVLGQQGNVR